MFTTGQLTFAALFVVAFVVTLIFMYRKDLKIHKSYYKNSYKILIVFLAFIAMLFVMKSILKD